MRSPAIRVLSLQSKWMISEAIATALKSDSFEIVYSGCDVDQAMSAIAAGGVDIALIHQTIALDRHGIPGLADQIRLLHSNVHMILILEERNPRSVVEAFRAGAAGVLTENSSLAQLSDCITWVHKGNVWASSIELEYLVSSIAQRFTAMNGTAASLLSLRERQVVDELIAGLTNREIGTRLGLSECTVRNHLYRIFDKVGVYSRVELAVWMAAHTNDAETPTTMQLASA